MASQIDPAQELRGLDLLDELFGTDPVKCTLTTSEPEPKEPDEQHRQDD